MRDQDLWARVSTYDFDPGAPFGSFAAQLARQTGWRRSKAQAAMEEYRRFLYLSVVSEVPVAPSEDIDRVWHMHLGTPWDYWGRLCPEVLRQSLRPAKVRSDQDQVDRAAIYDETRALYVEEFGALPPLRFWPDPDAGPRLRWRAFTAAAVACIAISVLSFLPISGLWAVVLPVCTFAGLVAALAVAGGATAIHTRSSNGDLAVQFGRD